MVTATVDGNVVDVSEGVEGVLADTLPGVGGNAEADAVFDQAPFIQESILALAEDVLRQNSPGRGEIPASAQAAERLGWTQTAFNRKLDNVCDKLDRFGVPGLRGGRGKLATNRRSRLVEYAVSTRMVDPSDLVLLDHEAEASAKKAAAE